MLAILQAFLSFQVLIGSESTAYNEQVIRQKASYTQCSHCKEDQQDNLQSIKRCKGPTFSMSGIFWKSFYAWRFDIETPIRSVFQQGQQCENPKT